MMRKVNMSKRDLNILLAFLGAIILLVSYIVICGRFRSEEETLRQETRYIQPTLYELQEHELRVDFYKQEIEVAKEKIAKLRLRHPEMVLPEEFIQFIVGLEGQLNIDARSITPHETEALSDFILPDADGNSSAFTAYRQSFTVTASMSYGDLKKVVEKIYAQSERITLDSCSVAYNAEDGLLTTTIVISQIFVNDGSYTYVPVNVTPGRVGTENPFGTLG